MCVYCVMYVCGGRGCVCVLMRLHTHFHSPCKSVTLIPSQARLRSAGGEEISGQGTVLGVREFVKSESHSWIVRFEQPITAPPANFLIGVAPPDMDLNKSLGEVGCGIGEQPRLFGVLFCTRIVLHVCGRVYAGEGHQVSSLV